MIMHLIIKNFAIGEKPLSAEKIGLALKIPVRLSRDILQDLSNVNLVSTILEDERKERLYQPSLDINKLTVSYVLSCIDKKGTSHGMVIRNKDYDKVISMLEKFDRLIAKSGSNILIKDL